MLWATLTLRDRLLLAAQPAGLNYLLIFIFLFFSHQYFFQKRGGRTLTSYLKKLFFNLRSCHSECSVCLLSFRAEFQPRSVAIFVCKVETGEVDHLAKKLCQSELWRGIVGVSVELMYTMCLLPGASRQK